MDIHALIDQAEAHVEAGRPDEAHHLYTSLLQALPRDIDLMLAVAKVYNLMGRPKAAKQLLLRALTLDALNVQVLGALAHYYLRIERNRDAARELLTQVLELDAMCTAAWLELGHIQVANGQTEEASACYDRALSLDIRSVLSLSPIFYVVPVQEDVAGRLINSLEQVPKPKAIALELMLALNAPEGTADSFAALLAHVVQAGDVEESLLDSLGELALALGRLGMAATCAHVQANRHPDNPFKLGVLADVLVRQGRFKEARQAWSKVLALDPGRSDAQINSWVAEIGCADQDANTLGARLIASVRQEYPDTGKTFAILAGAAQSLHQTDLTKMLLKALLEDEPDNLEALNQLAGFYFAENQPAEAIAAYEAILEKEPNRPDVYASLLNLSGRARCPEKAADWIDKVIELDDPGSAVLSVYNIAKSLCLWDEAATMRSRVVGDFRSGKLRGTVLTGTCFNMLGDAAVDNDTLFAMHLSVAEGFRKAMKHPPYTRHPALERTDGRMRIGYVSGDFATHVVNGFFSGLINHCDRSRFEVFCYSTRPEATEDHVSYQYRLAVDRFINVAAEDDVTLAKRIYDDNVHVLVDLAGYTAYSRISVFTYTPAPVQVTYLGYSYSTGVAEVDYIIADPFLDGPRTGHYCAEKPLRLPKCFMNFGEVKPYPLSDDIPFDQYGYITFGTMNKSQKMNPEVIRLWSKVLTAVPGSRMVMKRFDYALERTRERIWLEFERNGIERERVRIVWQDETANYLDFYTTLDLALDPFPFTGATTTMETLRMGVPLVTLVGDAIAQRNSFAVMNNAGIDLTELYAFSEDEFVEKAVTLAMNPDRIRALHKAMPEAIHKSSLVRPERFARQMEAAFVEGWNRKYPDRRWGERADDRHLEWVALFEGTEIAVPGSKSDLFGYVLKEQERWFDTEWLFAVGFASTLSQVWEVSADPGVYALPMARQGADKVQVWNVSEVAAEQLKRGVARNDLENIQVEGANRVDLALPWQDPPDWLRLGAESGLSALGFVQSNREGLANADPVLLMPVTQRDWAPLVGELAGLGYAPFTFVPGLNILAPFEAFHWDTFIRNLFFIKVSRLQGLLEQGLAVSHRVSLDSEPAPDANYWQDLLAGMPYAEDYLERWQGKAIDEMNREHYLALNLFALSRYEGASLDLRLACLEKAAVYSLSALVGQASIARLLTAARILAESGRRSKAVQCLNQLVSQVTGEDAAAADLDEPFLSLESAWEEARPANDVAGWLFAMVLSTGDKWRAHSTRFTGLASLPVLDQVIATGWVTPEVVRRAALIRQRFHLEASPEGAALPT